MPYKVGEAYNENHAYFYPYDVPVYQMVLDHPKDWELVQNGIASQFKPTHLITYGKEGNCMYVTERTNGLFESEAGDWLKIEQLITDQPQFITIDLPKAVASMNDLNEPKEESQPFTPITEALKLIKQP